MTGEPKQNAGTSEVTEQKVTRWGEVKEFFSSNPTFVVTLLYLYVTAIGIVYSAALYAKFGINIFDYSEIADFLLAAFKNPVAFLSAGILAALSAAYALWIRLQERRLMVMRRQETEVRRRRANITPEEKDEEEYIAGREEWHTESFLRIQIVFLVITVPVAIVFISLILPYVSATTTASSLKAGERPVVDVRYRSFKGSAGQVTEPGLELIGATQKAVFFYDVDDKRTLVIPQTQLVSIEVPEQD